MLRLGVPIFRLGANLTQQLRLDLISFSNHLKSRCGEHQQQETIGQRCKKAVRPVGALFIFAFVSMKWTEAASIARRFVPLKPVTQCFALIAQTLIEFWLSYSLRKRPVISCVPPEAPVVCKAEIMPNFRESREWAGSF